MASIETRKRGEESLVGVLEEVALPAFDVLRRRGFGRRSRWRKRNGTDRHGHPRTARQAGRARAAGRLRSGRRAGTTSVEIQWTEDVADESFVCRVVIKTGRNAVVIATLVLLMSTACGGSSSHELGFRTYDPLGHVKVEVTESDVLRSSARAAREPDGSWSFSFRLTDEGQAEFRRLTRALAKRGARLHRPLRCVTEMNGTVLSRSTVDYRIFPDGYGAEEGMWFPGFHPAAARRLANQMRKG